MYEMKFALSLVLLVFSDFICTSVSKEYYGYKASKRKCYMCTYNAKNGWDRCEGPVTEKSAKKYWIDAKDCDYNCYLKQDLYGNVERGCYAGEYLVNPNLLGCHWQSNSLYCFCEGEKCNIQPKLRIEYTISKGLNSLPINQVVASGKGDPNTNGLTFGVAPTKATSDSNERSPFYQALPTEEVRSTVAAYEVVPATKHGPNKYFRQGNFNTLYDDESDSKYSRKYDTSDDPKMYYTPLRTTASTSPTDSFNKFGISNENSIVNDDTNENTKFQPQTVYAVPSKSSYRVTYPRQPIYVHELSSSPSPREAAYVMHPKDGDEVEPIGAPPVREDDLQVGGVKLEPKRGHSSSVQTEVHDLFPNGHLKSINVDKDDVDNDNDDYRDDFSVSGSLRHRTLNMKGYSHPVIDSSVGERRYDQFKDGHSRGHYKDDFSFNKDGYWATKDILAHTHSRDDSTKDEASSRHSIQDGGTSSKTEKHKFRKEVDRGERHIDLHYVDGDNLREHEEDHFVHKRDKDGKLNHKQIHKMHKTDNDYYKKKDREEDHYKYDTDHRNVLTHRKTAEDSGSRGYDKKYGSHAHDSNQGNTNSVSDGDYDYPFNFGGFGSLSGSSGSKKDRVLDVKENHQNYDKDDYFKLTHQEANGLQGSLTHVAGHNIKDHDEEGFDKKHKYHRDVLDERGDEREYSKHGHSRHKGSFHRKNYVKDEYDRGREHEGLVMAHQDYQTARDSRYNSAKGHVDEVVAHSHDKSSRNGDSEGHGGHFGDHFGLKDKNTDHNLYDSDHHSSQGRDGKHKIGHGDLYKYMKAKDGEKGKNVNQYEDSLQYDKEQDVDIHRSPHETTEQRHFKLRTRGRNSRLRLKEREDFHQMKQAHSKEGKHKKHYGKFKMGDGQVLRIDDSHERAGHGLKTTILLSHGFHPVAP